MPKQETKTNRGDSFTPVPSHFLSNPSIHPSHHGHYWKPPTDVYETEDEYVVKAEIAGMKVEDFSVQFHKQSLSISGKRNIEFEKCALHQIEILSGEFRILIEVSIPVDKDRIHVDYQNGFLTIALTKIKDKK